MNGIRSIPVRGCLAVLFYLLAGGPAVADSASGPTSNSSAPPARVESAAETKQHLPARAAAGKSTLSPLHAFLGIDPVSGEFVGEGSAANARTQPPSADTNPNSTQKFVDRGNQIAANSAAWQELADDLPPESAALLRQLQAVSQSEPTFGWNSLPRLFEGPVDPRGIASLSWSISLATALIFMIFPVTIAISEGFRFWMSRQDLSRLPSEQRYERARLRRGLLQALLWTAAIWLAAVGSHAFAWWASFPRAVIFWAGVVLLSIGAWSVGKVIRLSATRHRDRLSRELRRYVLETRQELDELRRQLAQLEDKLPGESQLLAAADSVSRDGSFDSERSR